MRRAYRGLATQSASTLLPFVRAALQLVSLLCARLLFVPPLCVQDVTRISHSDSVADMIRKGRDLERLVLARAVRWHLASAVLVEGNKTVVFMS